MKHKNNECFQNYIPKPGGMISVCKKCMYHGKFEKKYTEAQERFSYYFGMWHGLMVGLLLGYLVWTYIG